MERKTKASIVAVLVAAAGIAFARAPDAAVQLTKAVPAMASLAGWSNAWTTPTAQSAAAPMATAAVAAAVDPCTESPNSAGQTIRVGNPGTGPRFNRNGTAWNMRSIQIRGFVSSIPTAQFLQNTQGIGQATIDAQNIYGTAELQAAWQKFGANTLRFQVSQHDLDAQDDRSGGMPAYDPAYKTAVLNAIQLARSKCFVVIVSMQAQLRSGVISRKTIAYRSTRRAWDNLLTGAGAFITSDPGIMLEVYNEPGGPNQVVTAADWNLWAHASQVTPAYEGAATPENQIYGMQPMINFLRGAPYNSQNVIIVDGLKIADTFAQVDSLVNPLDDPFPLQNDQIAYAVHPYIRGRLNDTSTQWNNRFGFLRTAGSNGRPPVMVIGTEWSAGEGDPDLGIGSSTSPTPNPPGWQVAVDLLNYVRSNSIPMGAGAMDIPGVMSQDPRPTNQVWTPTNYDNWDRNNCDVSRNNAGLLISTLFKNNYGVAVVKADGTTNNQPGSPIWCP